MGAGLIAAWSTIWNFTILVWTKPQWDAKRVEIRRKKAINNKAHETLASHESPQLNGFSYDPDMAPENSSSVRHNLSEQRDRNLVPHTGQEIDQTSLKDTVGSEKNVDGVSSSSLRERKLLPKQSNKASRTIVGNQTKAESAHTTDDGTGQEFEYYWQGYPDDGSFISRLSWAFDIVSTFRMTGWNWAIRCIPPYHPPPRTAEGKQLPLDVLPNRSKEGYTRTLSRKTLFIERLLTDIVPSYILLDLCAVIMTQDPYFIVGPEKSSTLPLPPNLATMHPVLLSLYRTAFSFIGILTALQLALSAGALSLCFLLGPPVLGFRAHPWHLPTAFGSFEQVLDRGLAGFWGAWWHQTFRFGFEAPGRWLLARRRRHHHHHHNNNDTDDDDDDAKKHITTETKTKTTPSDRLLAATFAFLQSGLLHAAGSYSTIPATKWWQPPCFFALAGAGSTLQRFATRSSSPLDKARRTSRAPRWARRLANLTFVLAWLWATGWLLVDDFARCGLWLYEPVPVSLFRALGFGPAGDRRVWRYDADFLPRWYWGNHWWESGIAI